MIDTAEIKHYFTKSVGETKLRDLGAIELRRKYPTFALNPAKGESRPLITFVFPPDNVMHLYALFSIPKLLYGHNTKLPADSIEVWNGLQIASDYVEAKTGLAFDAATASVSKVHFARDINLGEANVIPTIKRLTDRTLQRFNRMPLNDSTVYFKSAETYLRIYSKLHEVLTNKNVTPEMIEAARGNLRIEYCLRPRSVQSAVKSFGLVDRTTSSILTDALSHHFIDKALDDLAFSQCISDQPSNLERLSLFYPWRKAWTLNSFLEAIGIYGERFYCDTRHKLKKSTYEKYARECRKAQVWTFG